MIAEGWLYKKKGVSQQFRIMVNVKKKRPDFRPTFLLYKGNLDISGMVYEL
jgi:hypothetical protein